MLSRVKHLNKMCIWTNLCVISYSRILASAIFGYKINVARVLPSSTATTSLAWKCLVFVAVFFSSFLFLLCVYFSNAQNDDNINLQSQKNAIFVCVSLSHFILFYISLFLDGMFLLLWLLLFLFCVRAVSFS